MMSMSLGRTALHRARIYKTPEGIEKTLRRIKQMGFKTIQISAFGPVDRNYWPIGSMNWIYMFVLLIIPLIG